MAIYHIAYHGYRVRPSPEQFEAQIAMLNAAFAAAPSRRRLRRCSLGEVRRRGVVRGPHASPARAR